MLPFPIELRPGQPVQQQVIHAVRRAVVAGLLRAGDPFPSVRGLSHALRINPNTAHRIIAVLVSDGILEVRAGVGSVITGTSGGNERERSGLLDHQLERLVVEARRLGIDRSEFDAAIQRHWRQLSTSATRRHAAEPRRSR
jgi:GntR family transcriptional regulator